MTNVSVNETCRCGAKFEASGDTLAVANRHTKFHNHHAACQMVAPGMCGEPSNALLDGDARKTVFCQLRAGHAGFHEDGEGCSWGHPTWTTTAADA